MSAAFVDSNLWWCLREWWDWELRAMGDDDYDIVMAQCI